MKISNLYLIFTIVTVVFASCKKKDSDPDVVNPSNQTTIIINDNPFTPTSTKALSNADRDGYDIVLTDNQTSINLSTSAKEAGTYVACSDCKVASGNTFSGSIVSSQGEYNIKSGTLILSFNSDGTLEAVFTVEAADNDNNTITITDGKVTNLGIVTVSEEENFKAILMSKTWYITKYNYSFTNEEYQSGEFVADAVVTGSSESNGGCPGTFYIRNYWNYYQAKFTESKMIGIYNLTEKEEQPDEDCNINITTTTKSDTRNKTWTYNATTKKLATDFGNMFDAGEDADADFATNYDVISYSSGKIVLEGTKEGGNGQTFYGKIVLE